MSDWIVRPRARRAHFWGILVVVCFLSGCQTTTRVGDRYYANGRLPEAAAAYQVYLDSGTSDKEQTTRTLYRLGVIFATPGSSAYDPHRSVEILEQLISLYPGSLHTPEATLLRNLQLEIRDLKDELTADQARLTELAAILAEREDELARTEQEVGDRDSQIVALQDSISPLRLEIRELIREVASKQRELEQLERLKAIDLDQPPP